MSTNLAHYCFSALHLAWMSVLFAETLSMGVSVSDLGSLKVPPWVYPPSPHSFHVLSSMVSNSSRSWELSSSQVFINPILGQSLIFGFGRGSARLVGCFCTFIEFTLQGLSWLVSPQLETTIERGSHISGLCQIPPQTRFIFTKTRSGCTNTRSISRLRLRPGVGGEVRERSPKLFRKAVWKLLSGLIVARHLASTSKLSAGFTMWTLDPFWITTATTIHHCGKHAPGSRCQFCILALSASKLCRDFLVFLPKFSWDLQTCKDQPLGHTWTPCCFDPDLQHGWEHVMHFWTVPIGWIYKHSQGTTGTTHRRAQCQWRDP